jgi:P-type Ca2+ transporter type 2C
LGFYQSFRPGATDKVEWVEGMAILVAVVVITVVQSLNDYQKEPKFKSLYEKVMSVVNVTNGPARKP